MQYKKPKDKIIVNIPSQPIFDKTSIFDLGTVILIRTKKQKTIKTLNTSIVDKV